MANPNDPLDENGNPSDMSSDDMANADMTPEEIAAIFDFTPGQQQKQAQLEDDTQEQELAEEEVAAVNEEDALEEMDIFSKLEYAIANKRHIMLTYQKVTRGGMPTMPAETYVAMPAEIGSHNKSGGAGFLWAEVIQREGAGNLGIKSFFLSQIVDVKVLNTTFV